MAVAALSTSALALAAGSTPAPATQGAAPAPEAFAKLVQRARPDEMPTQDGATPEGSAEGETETAVGSDDSAPATAESEIPDLTAASPTDLLARINAMVEAASQIGISVPSPVAAPVAVVTTEAAPTAAPVTVGAAPTPALPVIKTVQAPAPANIAAPQAEPVAKAASTQQPAPTAVTAPEAEALRAAVASLPEAEAAPIEKPAAGSDEVVRPAVLQKGSDIAQLLASLRTAFAAVETGAAAVPVPAAIPVAAAPAAPQPAVTPAPAAPVTAEAVQPQPAVIAAIATTEAPVSVAEPPVAGATIEESPRPAAPQAPDVLVAETAPRPKADAPIETALLDLPIVDTDQPSLPADIPLAADSDAPADSAEAPAAPVIASVETTTPLPTAAPVAPAPTAAAPADGATPVTAHVDQIVDRQLDLVKDHQWLDRLARDISHAATRDGQLRFQLNPEHLGALTVEIANSAAGTAIRMTADSDQARSIIADAQPRLLAEVRAQGLRVSEAHVDLNQQQQQQSNSGSTSAQAQQQQQQNRQSSEDSKPFARTQTGIRDDADDSAGRDTGELYA